MTVRFEKGHKRGGRPPNTPNKEKLYTNKDFVMENKIDVPALWFESIMATPPGPYRAKLLEGFYKSYIPTPKPADAPTEVVPESMLDVSDSVNVLQIVSGDDQK